MFSSDSRGPTFLLAILVLMFVVDPAYSYIRRRFDEDYPRYAPPRKAFRILTFVVPALTFLVSARHYARVEGAAGLFWVFWIVGSCFIGRYYYNRSRDKPAHLPGFAAGAWVEPDDPEFANDLYDLMAICAGAMFVLLPAILFLMS